MKTLFTLLLSTLFAAASAQAAEPSKAQVIDAAKALVKPAAALCDGCLQVTAVATEKRKGKASGVGLAGGAVAGGVVGHKVGDSTVATVGGAVVGGVVGNEIEKRLHKHTVWVVSTTARDGSVHKHEFEKDPQFKVGDVVVADGKGLKKR